MPGLVKKLLITAAVDGLLLHPIGTHHEKDSGGGGSGIRISYGSSSRIISSPALPPNRSSEDGGVQSPGTPGTLTTASPATLESFGIIGLLDLITTSYLISITRREQVAQIRGKPVFGVRDVVLIPLSSKVEAEKVIKRVGVEQRKGVSGGEESEREEMDEAREALGDGEVSADESEGKEGKESSGGMASASAVVKNVMQDRGKYGRFAERWFSKGGGWNEKGRRVQGMDGSSSEEGDVPTTGSVQMEVANGVFSARDEEVPSSKLPSEEEASTKSLSPSNKPISGTSTPIPVSKRAIETLAPRILKAARLYFSSSGFYFSYEHDLSTTLGVQQQQQQQRESSVPMWKRFDRLYFWNRHLIAPFIDAGSDGFVLPILLGFVGQKGFSVGRREDEAEAEEVKGKEEKGGGASIGTAQAGKEKESGAATEEELLLTLISRRSVNRAGLRYLRRGIDDDGNVANMVETEQILSYQSWDSNKKSFSLVQLRGSIPLFFSQSPYSFKPTPVFFGSETTNQAAFKKHFAAVAKRYGSIIQAASLVDRHGTEVTIGELYERHADILNENGGVDGKSMGFEWFDFHGACKGMKFENVSLLIEKLESSLAEIGWGVRENERQVKRQKGILRTNCMDCLDRTNVVQSAIGGWVLQKQLMELGEGLSIDLLGDADTRWFNGMWADNGDAISKQYAGTSALKGDFTRNRKRNWTGALSDFSLTLNRYFNNLTGDYFLQTNIDYFLGNTSPAAFDDFVSDMQNADPRIDIGRIRQNAIDTCTKIVLEEPDKEDFIAGWTLSCPHEANTLRGTPFEECVLLLTNAALYFCRFDWDTEKVGSFEKIGLRDVVEIWKGAYITSILGPTHVDPEKNVGFALRYLIPPGGEGVVRTNTRSMQNETAVVDENSGKNELEKQAKPEKDERRLLAFKALTGKGEGEGVGQSIGAICGEVQKALKGLRGGDVEVEERDVISIADARKNTGLVEQLGYGLKKLVWS